MKTYVGNGKEGKYGYVNFSVELDKLLPYTFEYNGKKYVKLTMAKKKEVDQYGKSHTIYIDEYKPEAKEEVTNAQHNPDRETVNDLPF
jgi:hypothetical protein